MAIFSYRSIVLVILTFDCGYEITRLQSLIESSVGQNDEFQPLRFIRIEYLLVSTDIRNSTGDFIT